MKGFKTVVFFTLTGLVGLVAALQSVNLADILLPMVCHTDSSVEYIETDCTIKIVQIAGYWTTGLSTFGLILRSVTNSPIFKSFFGY